MEYKLTSEFVMYVFYGLDSTVATELMEETLFPVL